MFYSLINVSKWFCVCFRNPRDQRIVRQSCNEIFYETRPLLLACACFWIRIFLLIKFFGNTTFQISYKLHNYEYKEASRGMATNHFSCNVFFYLLYASDFTVFLASALLKTLLAVWKSDSTAYSIETYIRIKFI